jgi:menaquinone-specific isochorismate synthase
MTYSSNWASLGASWLQSGAILGISNGRVLLGAGKVQRSSRPDFLAGNQASFYAPDFFLTHEKPWLNFETTFEVSTLELLQHLTELNLSSSVEPLHWPAPPKDRFERAFDHLQNEIRKGILEKGVPFTFERANASMTPPRLLASLKAMLTYALERPVMPYGFWETGVHGAEGILGCTPELLFRRDGKTIRTMAMAGTRRHDEQGRLPLLDDPKERREHQLVINSIASELQPFGEVIVEMTEVAVLPQLSHLKTLIELHPEKSDVSFDELIRSLHPTPALGAFPREAGWKWLQLLESQNDLQRGRYGAPFGAVWKDAQGQDQGLAVVAIRNVQWQDERILLCAGCGVIAESEFEREWQEVNGKIRAVKGILAL